MLMSLGSFARVAVAVETLCLPYTGLCAPSGRDCPVFLCSWSPSFWPGARHVVAPIVFFLLPFKWCLLVYAITVVPSFSHLHLIFLAGRNK